MTVLYDVVALAELETDVYADLRDAVYERLSTFECKRSPHLQDFARGKVGRYEQHGHSRTYVFICPVEDSDIDVPAFFTVGMTALDLTKATGSKKKKLSGDISMDITGTYSIAELARSDRYTSSQLPGAVILDEAKQVIAQAKSFVGGRFAVVDARKAVFEALYQPAGFSEIHIASAPLGMEEDDFITAACLIRDW
ncbi:MULTISPECIES: hypothetical protein [unclassified Rathayibacter]|uniref:hypothetical protein n=1 Tax=unclassified Rathayibacter TaxID=2609250 RepID=UPI00104FC246|nr:MULTISPECIES: hypothetical protein [unclassified Rathayibacter]